MVNEFSRFLFENCFLKIDVTEEHSSFKKKIEQAEKDKKKIIDDKDQFKMLFDNIQKNLDMETKEKEKINFELISCKKEKEQVF